MDGIERAEETTMLADVLGLSGQESAAYRDLVAVASTTADELAARLELSAPESEQVLWSLEQRGLVARSSSDGRRFVAAPPAIALGALLTRREDEIRHAQAELTRLEEIYRAVTAGREPTEVIDVIHGAQSVRDTFEQIQLGARSEVLALVKPPVTVTTAQQNSATEYAAVQRGVGYRVIIERAMFEIDPEYLGQAVEAVRAGVFVRIADTVPVKLVIADRRLAFLPVAVDLQRPQAMLLHPSGLLDALLALFENCWDRAIPFEPPGADLGDEVRGRLEPVDVQVLGLLLVGMTDQAVAGQLDTSLRTVQRRVRMLMDLAGVDTRMQLGWHAARRGWL
jgi:sugar-specific transcriptional regulator TrmB/DNA-binding CsgD family transcriptional regulator